MTGIDRQRKETDVLLCAQEVDLVVQEQEEMTVINIGQNYIIVVDVKVQIVIDGFYVF